MMMKTSVQHMCEDLDQLLKDICDFLSNQINDDDLTESQRLFANKLVQRSKKQLTQISTVSMALSADDDSSYVDMNKQSAPVEIEEPTYEDGQDNEYTPIVCEEMPPTEIVCPYKDLSAKEVDERSEKSGPLERKSRFLLFSNQKKYFAAMKGNWLLLYCTKTSLKPADSLNLNCVLAKPTEGMRTKTFELICTATQKTFYFVAQTPKDMVQWVACINKKTGAKEEPNYVNQMETQEDEEENVYEPLKINDEPAKDTLKKKMKPLPPLPKTSENTYILRRPNRDFSPPEIMESYDELCKREDPHIEDDDHEEIYDVIEDVKAKQLRKEVKKPPMLPPMRAPVKQTQVEALVSNHVVSDDDEEQVYDVLEDAPPSKPIDRLGRRPPDPEPEEEYDNVVARDKIKISQLETVKEIRKPLPPMPPLLPSLSEQSRSDSLISKDTDFSDDDEERIYDVLEQPPPKQPTGRLTKRPPDPEPEEEYQNLAIHRYKQQDLVSMPPLIPSLSEQSRTDSFISNNTDFSDEDEERIYDVLEQPPPKQPTGRLTKRPPDPEPEEEYCNLAVHQYKQQDLEPEEEYGNLVSIQNSVNKGFSPNRGANKNQETKKVEEKSSNYPPRVPITGKIPSLSRPVLKPKPISQPKIEVQNVNNDDEEEEYDCVVSQPNTTLGKSNKTKPISNVMFELRNRQNEKLKKEPPTITPKPLKPIWK